MLEQVGLKQQGICDNIKEVYGKHDSQGFSNSKNLPLYYHISPNAAKELAEVLYSTVTTYLEKNQSIKIKQEQLTEEDWKKIAKCHIEAKLEKKGSLTIETNKNDETKLIHRVFSKYIKEKSKAQIEARFINVFNALNNILYRQPTETEKKWLRDQGVSENIVFYNQQSRGVKANIELKQRAFSFINAAWLIAKTENSSYDNSTLEKYQETLFNLFKEISDKIDNAGSNLIEAKAYKAFLKNEIEKTFISKILAFLVNQLKLPQKQAGKILHQFECFTNWELQSRLDSPAQGFAVTTKSAVTAKSNDGYIIRISKPINPKLTHEQKNEFQRIMDSSPTDKPKWFTALPPLTQQWLKQNVPKIIDGTLACPHSVLRFIPGLANVREDLVFFTNKTGEVQTKSSSIRLSVSTPVSIADKHEQQRIAALNATQAVTLLASEDNKGLKEHFDLYFADHSARLTTLQPFAIYQRLLSPVTIADNTGFSGSDNNTYMLETMRNTIQEVTNKNGINVFCPNWPINASKDLAENPFEDLCNQQTAKSLISFGKNLAYALGFGQKQGKTITINTNFLETIGEKVFPKDPVKANQCKLAFCALQEYQKIWKQYEKDKKILNPHKINIHLRMAALEMIIAEGFGLKATSGCKSAKDREAVLSMEIAAINQFFLIEKRIPEISQAADVKKMAEYFAEEFVCDYHQEVVSNCNSFGDSAIQDGKGPTTLLEKFKNFSQMIPPVYLSAIGEKLKTEFPTSNFQLLGKETIDRQDTLGKSATWGKPKEFLGKIITGIKELFQGAYVKKADAVPLKVEKCDADISLAASSIRKEPSSFLGGSNEQVKTLPSSNTGCSNWEKDNKSFSYTASNPRLTAFDGLQEALPTNQFTCENNNTQSQISEKTIAHNVRQ